MTASIDKFQGCVLGLALGDAMGAPFEGGIPERLLWRLIGKTRRGEMRWSDDTQMSIDVIESLLAMERVDPDDLAVRFARSYRWSRGYGPGTAKVLGRIARGVDWREANRSVYRNGSLGNGAAMRAPIIGVAYANRPYELDDAARLSAMPTHAHAIGLESAVFIARATASATRGDAPIEILRYAMAGCAQEQFLSRSVIASEWLVAHSEVSIREVTSRLGFRVSAHESCVTAAYLALRHIDRSFLDLQRFIATGRGDIDTVGAMAGAIWGAARGAGALPADQLRLLEQQERLTLLATSLHQQHNRSG